VSGEGGTKETGQGNQEYGSDVEMGDDEMDYDEAKSIRFDLLTICHGHRRLAKRIYVKEHDND
jgi:hypothetical protein